MLNTLATDIPAWLNVLNRSFTVLVVILLIAIITLTILFTRDALNDQSSARPFYLGVEYAYGVNQTDQVQLAEIQGLVQKVKTYTNLFVLGTVTLTFNQTALNEACDYIYQNKLSFIVLFTGSDMYNYNIRQWMYNATTRYGDKFLGVYKYDEPGGNQLDNTRFQLINKTVIEPTATNSDIAANYVGNLTFMIDYYQNNAHVNLSTADYGLYWFNYKSHYHTIYAEFVGNESRQRIIALDRGAATAFGKDWGVIINWKYNQDPYLESGSDLYEDLALAYSSGAKYAILFSYPTYPDNNLFGIIQDEHFDALEKFWNTLRTNPASFGKNEAIAAYIVPRDYGFGFRHENDTIWGLKPADALSAKLFNDANFVLPAKYGSRFDVLYDEPEKISPLLDNYSVVYYWNQTIT